MRLASPAAASRPRRPPLVLGLAALVVAGCGHSATTTVTYQCQPACPAGSHCEADGCVADFAALPDLPAATPDLAAGCGGGCAGATPVCDPGSGQCVACLVDGDCPAGQVCRALGAGRACVTGCGDDARCGGGSARCCGGACVDTATDPLHCGACDASCGNAQAHATVGCVASVCTLGACDPRYADCNHDATDGCETNVAVDAANCGACGSRCSFAHGRGACGGGCYLAACDFGYDDCNGDAADGCEKALLDDPQNCGACGQACGALPHAKVGCRNAACQLDTCDRGFADCDGNTQDGCETNVLVDKANCGACGVACPPGNVCTNGGCTCPQCMLAGAVSKCVNNQCTFDHCLADFADCDNNLANGCEVSLLGDSKNCGACGAACPKDQVCVGGKCSSAVCQKGVRLDIAPGGDMVVCDDPNDATCEQDFATLCPLGWRLCTARQHENRRANWNYPVDQNQKKVLLGEIVCRGMGGIAGAGHLTIPDSNNQPQNAGDAVNHNCYFGSSRPTCVTGYGCNEQFASALCCAPTLTCGNGQVDAPEEDCDDGNQDDTDACLSDCTWRIPIEHGLGGTNCG